MSVDTAIVAGAGVAGLITAIALAQKGARVHCFEQASVLSEVGAGLQISANGARILDQMNVLPRLSGLWLEPETITLASGQSLAELTNVPMGARGKARWGAPYGVLHRATLQAALLKTLEAEPNCSLHLGQRVENPDSTTFEQMIGQKPDLIVGADGVWSKMRNLVPGAGKTAFSGYIAWRFLIPASKAPAFLAANRVTAFTGPRAHMVTYPLKEADAFNLVVIAAGANPGENWSISSSHEQVLHFVETALSGWHPAIRALLLAADKPTWWPLFGVGPGKWTDGKSIALVGDAAHAMLPFAAQGAVMAIEDGFELANLAMSMPVSDALARYELIRQPRVAKIKARGEFNRFAYHARGPVRLARNFVLATRPAEKLAADLDWIYNYRAGASKA
jgi:salicylate hydroxylase